MFITAVQKEPYYDVYDILNRIKLLIWPICAFQVLNHHQRSLIINKVVF